MKDKNIRPIYEKHYEWCIKEGRDTTWYDDYQQIDRFSKWKPTPGLQWAIKGNILNDIDNYLNDIQMLYFSGGEPLLNKKHNGILNLLIEKNIQMNKKILGFILAVLFAAPISLSF